MKELKLYEKGGRALSILFKQQPYIPPLIIGTIDRALHKALYAPKYPNTANHVPAVYIDDENNYIGFKINFYHYQQLLMKLAIPEKEIIDFISTHQGSLKKKFKLQENEAVEPGTYLVVLRKEFLKNKIENAKDNFMLYRFLLKELIPTANLRNVIKNQYKSRLQYILAETNAATLIKDNKWKNLFVLAIETRNSEIIAILLDFFKRKKPQLFQGLFKDKEVLSNWNPWKHILEENDIHLLKLMLDAGLFADPLMRINGIHQTPLRYAIATGNLALVQTLVDYANVDYESGFSGNTPLHTAIQQMNRKNKEVMQQIVHLLLGAGANPEPLNVRYKTPLDMAIEKNDNSTQQILFSACLNEQIGFKKYKPFHEIEVPTVSLYPSTFSKLWINSHLQSKSKSVEKNNYDAAIALLCDYSKIKRNSNHTVKDTISQYACLFFSGHWKRHHKSVVYDVIVNAKHENQNVETLLTSLKTAFIHQCKSLNLDGDLAKTIDFIQLMTKTSIIDIHKINEEIFGPNLGY